MGYIWLLSIRPAPRVGTYAYVNPVVAVVLGWLIAGEHVSLQNIIGLAVIIAGLVVVNMSKEKKVATIAKPSGQLSSVAEDQESKLSEREAS